MKNHWQNRPLVALGVAVLCLVVLSLIARQGDLTLRIFDLDFGFSHIKSHYCIVWYGEFHRLPFNPALLLLLSAFVSVSVAVYFIVRHFISRRADA